MLQSRIVESLSKPLANESAAFAQVYGSLVGLAELGPDVIRRVILPKMRKISDRIEAVQVNVIITICLIRNFREPRKLYQVFLFYLKLKSAPF